MLAVWRETVVSRVGRCFLSEIVKEKVVELRASIASELSKDT